MSLFHKKFNQQYSDLPLDPNCDSNDTGYVGPYNTTGYDKYNHLLQAYLKTREELNMYKADHDYEKTQEYKFPQATKKLLSKIGLKKDEISGGYDLDLNVNARFTAEEFGNLSPKEMEEVINHSIEKLKADLMDKLTAKQTITKICTDMIEKEEAEVVITKTSQKCLPTSGCSSIMPPYLTSRPSSLTTATATSTYTQNPF